MNVLPRLFHAFLGGVQFLVAQGEDLLLTEIEVQLLGILRVEFLAAAAEHLALEPEQALVHLLHRGVLLGDDGVFLNDDCAQAVYDGSAPLLGDVLAVDVRSRLREVLDVLLARHCRFFFSTMQIYKEKAIQAS